MKTNGSDADKCLWIFGAGASAPSGFPVSNELFRRAVQLIMEHCNGRYPDEIACLKECNHWPVYLHPQGDAVRCRISNGLARYLSNLVQELKSWGLIEKYEDILDRNPENIIKTIVAMEPNERQKDWPAGRFDMCVEGLRKTAIQAYFYILSEFNQMAEIRKNNPYRDLVRQREADLERYFETRTKIISFNYDTLLDEAFSKYHTTFWNYEGISLSAINGISVSVGSRDRAAATVGIIKPHGSLNFLHCNECEGTSIYDDWAFKETGAGAASDDNRRCPCSEAGSTYLSAQLTPPLYNKKIYNMNKDAMEKAFSWCDRIIVIGYSFPDQDRHVYDAVREGIAGNGHKRTIPVKIVDRGHDDAAIVGERLLKNLDDATKARLDVEACCFNGIEQIPNRNIWSLLFDR